MSNVKIIDTPEGNRFFKEMDRLFSSEVRIGYFQGESTEPGGIDVCENAAMQEFGTLKIPARPFMAQSVDNNMDIINQAAEASKMMMIAGESADEVLGAIGDMQKSLIEASIMSGDFVPNQKGTQPLIDSGTMLSSVSYKVEKKRSGG